MKKPLNVSTMLLFFLLASILAACAAPGSPVLDLNGTNWQVVEINGQTVVEDMDVTANFGADGQVSGTAACNQYFANYTQDGDLLTIGPVGMTKKMCIDSAVMETEQAFAQALGSIQRFVEDGEQLRLLDQDGQAVLVLGKPRPAPALDQTSWQLVELNGQSVPTGVVITLNFADGQATGRAACNSFFAGYTQDNSALTFSQVGGTEMYCEGLMDYEAATYAALQQVASFTLKNDVLSLFDGSGTAVLVYGLPQSAPSLADTNWKVLMVGDLQVAEGLEVTMAFEEGRIGGKSACNSYGADYTQDGSSLTFGLAVTTLMFCEGEGVMDTEAAFQSSLEKVRSFQFELGNLLLLDENGQTILVLGQP